MAMMNKENPRVTLGQWYKAIDGSDMPIGKSWMVILQEFREADRDEVLRVEKHNREVMESGKGEQLEFPDRVVVGCFNGIPANGDIKKIREGDKKLGVVTTRSYLVKHCIRDMEKIMEVGKESE